MNNMVKLSEWAKDNNIDYRDAWKQAKAGVLPVKTKISKTNRIWVETSPVSEKKELNAITPTFSGGNTKESLASSRRNRASSIERTNPYTHIENGINPFQISRSRGNNDFVSVNDAIRLTQQCYYNFSIFRNVIDVMAEFSSNNIFLKGGNAKSRDFFDSLFKKFNIIDLQDKFFREYYRSGNVFINRFDSVPLADDILKLNKIYHTQAAKTLELPVRYIILKI